jgi:hypothetical protein
MPWLSRVGALLGPLLFSGAVHAQTLTLKLEPEATGLLGLDEQTIKIELEGALDGELKLDQQQAFLEQMARATAISTKGIGVDYASNFKKFVVGGAVGSGAAGMGASFGKGEGGGKKGGNGLPEGGFAASVSLMVGINLGMFSDGEGAASRFRIYVNGMSMPLPSGTPFTGRMTNFGGHVQVKPIGEVDLKIMKWGGFDFTTGYEHSIYTMGLQEGLPISFPMGSGTELTWDASGDFELSATAGSIPLELSTNLRLFILTAYAGGAFDVLFADAESSAKMGGPLTGKADGVPKTEVGTASLSFSQAATIEPFAGRVFGGAQINILMVKVYGQLNVGLNDSFGGHLGARIAL